MDEIEPIIEAVEKATLLAHKLQKQGIRHSTKLGAGLVTTADYCVQAIICRTLSLHFPQDVVIAEEDSAAFLSILSTQDRQTVVKLIGEVVNENVTESDVVTWLDFGRTIPNTSGRTWIVDPIDGTASFANGKEYAVSVGLLQDGLLVNSIMGVSSNPIFPSHTIGTLLVGGIDTAYAEALPRGTELRTLIKTSEESILTGVRIVAPREPSKQTLNVLEKIKLAVGVDEINVEYWESMLKYVMVASGYADLYIVGPRHVTESPHLGWDHAAGAALVLAAGGEVTALNGDLIKWSDKNLDTLGIVVSNGGIHTEIVQILQGME